MSRPKRSANNPKKAKRSENVPKLPDTVRNDPRRSEADRNRPTPSASAVQSTQRRRCDGDLSEKPLRQKSFCEKPLRQKMFYDKKFFRKTLTTNKFATGTTWLSAQRAMHVGNSSRWSTASGRTQTRQAHGKVHLRYETGLRRFAVANGTGHLVRRIWS